MSAGISGIESLDAMIAQVKGLVSGPEYPRAAAAAAGTWLRSRLAAGVDPNTGSAWPKTLKGGQPLKTAPSRPTIRLVGSAVIISLAGYYVFQHFGTRGRTGRRVIPQGSMPPELGNAIRLGFVETFTAKTKAGKRGRGAR